VFKALKVSLVPKVLKAHKVLPELLQMFRDHKVHKVLKV
jgi:hypothetical protein